VSGEIHASAQTALLEDSRFVRDAAFERLRGAAEDSEVWGRLFSSKGTTDGDGNAATLDRDSSGVFFGADGQFSNTVRLGLLGGFSRNAFDGVRGDGNSSNLHIGAYVGGQWDALALRGGVAYSKYDIDTARSVGVGKVSDAPQSGDSGADMGQVFGEVGYRLGGEALNLEPFVNLANVSLSTDSFGETGGVSALKGQGDSTSVTFSTLGVNGRSAANAGNGNAVFKGTVGWRHAFGDTTPLSTLSFASGKAFTVAGVPVAENSVVLDLGLDFRAGDNVVFGVSYNGQFGSGVSDNGVRADLRVRF
jgi:outer membrane autotransporter protein